MLIIKNHFAKKGRLSMLNSRNLTFFFGLCLSGFTGIPVSFADGGISGGGGGSIPDNPAGAHLIEEILKDARGELLMLFHGGHESSGSLFGDELYSAPRNIYDVIRTTKIGIRRDGPCVGLDGKESDGSVVGPSEDSICISVHNLAQKLSKDNAHRQTLALVGHEYGHMLGLDEEAATRLQKFLLYYFEEYVQRREQGFFFDVVEKWRDNLSSVRAYLVRSLSVLSSPSLPDETRWVDACKLGRTAEKNFMDNLEWLDRKFKSYLPLEKYSYERDVKEMSIKFLGFRAATCGLQLPDHAERYDSKVYQAYVNAFGDKEQVNVEVFGAAFYGHGSPAREGLRSIRKIQTKETAIVEIQQMLDYVHGLHLSLDEFGIPTPLINF